MNNKRLYQETFSQVHGSADIRWEDYQTMRHGKNVKRLAMLAAAIALSAALSGLAVAANFFGLRNALLPERRSVNTDFISLSGYSDTPESKALAEWEAFLETYDRDGAIIGRIGNGPTGFEERYGNYLVYTQEMADKLEEITAKYGLKLHQWMEEVLPETWTAAGEFYQRNVTPYSGYIYENGTFRFDGDAELDGYGTIEYQFSRSVKGAFGDVALNVGDFSGFEEWGYQTADGTTVTLGLGERNRSLILTDLGDSFVLVNVLTGRQEDGSFSSGAIGREELEELADSFLYSALTPVKEPDREAILDANERYMEALRNQPPEDAPEDTEDPLYVQTGIRTDVAKDFVLLLAERLADNRRQEIAELMAYPLCVETADGERFMVNTPEEFLEHYDATVARGGLGVSQELMWEPEPLTPDAFDSGGGLVSAAGGAVRFEQIEESVIRVFTLQTDQWSVRAAGD